jgi:UDPglucose 6-dehydrogenase
MSDIKIGIVGMGTVGTAVYHSLCSVFNDITIFDPAKIDTDGSVLYDREFIFMCLPSPEELEATADLIISSSGREDIVFIIKTTMPIGRTEHLQWVYGNYFVYNPEFLTDRTAVPDFMNQHRIILGGAGSDMVEELYRYRFRHIPIYKVTSRTAEFVKMMTNLFFMNKISFMNEMHDIAKCEGLPWDSIVKLFATDGRIANSHLDVPGHDGERGFGGKCFPDNLDEMLRWMDEKNYDSKVVSAIKETNDKYR